MELRCAIPSGSQVLLLRLRVTLQKVSQPTGCCPSHYRSFGTALNVPQELIYTDSPSVIAGTALHRFRIDPVITGI